MVVQLEQWHYMVDMGCGSDMWGLCGKAFSHPHFKDGHFIMVSTPVELDEVNMIVKTSSGRLYELGECKGNLEQQLGYIREDIKHGGTSRRV